MPDVSEEQLLEATENFTAYMAAVRRIYERLHEEGKYEEAVTEEKRRLARRDQATDH